MTRRRWIRSAAFAAALALVAGTGAAAPGDGFNEGAVATQVATRNATQAIGPNATTAGAITTPSPTINFLSVEWAFSGDANANGRVGVRYRQVGTATWHGSLPLRRVRGGSNLSFSWATRHSGSLFDLAANTQYEIELALTDPDGGSLTRVVFAATRPVPGPMAGAPIKPATPATLASVIAGTQPGDIVDLAAGTYSGFTIARDGQPGMPIVVRSTAGAIVNGEIGLFNRHDVMITGLTVNGRIRFNGSNGMIITRNTINASAALEGHGILTNLRAENAYIADNTVTGVTPWTDAAMGANGANLGEGILVIGPGHVIEHNTVRHFRDNISLKEDQPGSDQYSIDIVENDISEAGDDGVEADFCAHNCRIVRNRFTNVFVAMSSQPGLGGPTWFIRNAAYNVAHVGFKLYRTSSGDVLLHNTIVKQGDAFGAYPGTTITDLLSRNNLFIGGPGGTYGGYGNGTGKVISQDYAVAPDMDHDAFGSTLGTFTGRIGTTNFTSLAQLRASTTEAHAVQVTLNVFAAAIASPAPLTQWGAQDLRPAAASTAVNAGTLLPGVNDGFAGAAPDIGAYELGAPVPAYGVRP